MARYDGSNVRPTMKTEPLTSTNYVDRAEEVINELGRYRLSTSQIRGFLDISQKIYDQAKRKTGLLSEEEIAEIQLLRIHLVYDAGRDNEVKKFVETSGLLKEVKKIGNDRKQLLLVCHYLEALVAYHKYMGGK